jgi:hypothetical protein
MAQYPLAVDTLGKLIDVGHHLQPHCDDCNNGLHGHDGWSGL